MSLPPERARAASSWPRRVTPELLDELPAEDPRALRSRADLRRINRIMGARSLLLRGLDSVAGPAAALVELGSGDGTMALRLARGRARRWPGARLTLLDREPSVAPETTAAIEALGWEAQIVAADALEWLGGAGPLDAVIFANLFVHHFEGDGLAKLLAGIAKRSRAFVCCEPRRSHVALAGSRLLGLIGCNEVTRHDAVVSVHAGFRDGEISTAWRTVAPSGWRVSETPAGAFSHLFVARRKA
jgi:hypothetical protein